MMAAELPRGRFRHRGPKQPKDPTIASMTTTTTTGVKSSMDLPSLVRTGPPPVGLRHVRLTLGGVSKFRHASRSMPDPVIDDHETKRRQKLRGVIAMMEMSKRPVKRKNDVETHLNESMSENVIKQQRTTHQQRAKAMEAAKRRTKTKGRNNQATNRSTNMTIGSQNEDGNGDDIDGNDDKGDDDDEDVKKKALATMGKWQSFVRRKKVLTKGRRAGFAGHLPIRKGSDASINRHRDDPKEKAKPKTLGKFRTVVKLVIYLLRLSRTYIYKESDARMVSLFSDIDAARAGDHYKIRGDLLYDVTEYKALKSQKISKDTKRILLMDPKKRSKKDIHHVMVELQQMKGLTQYPVDMQRGLVANSWYEEYPTGRVIIRYGRSPQAFYVILGGSALHLEGDPNIPGRPVSSLNKGDMFGEQAIAHQDKHVYTVISKEAIQLMCLAPNDYCRIFLAGGLDNFSDLGEHSFVRSISLFNHWPIHLLKDNHKQTRFQYFVHGTTIVEDSIKSEWIIIVKSGSCSVLKKLIDPTPNGIPAIAPIIKRKKSMVPVTRYKRDFIQPAETHQEMLTRKLKELQRKRARSIKNSKWQRYIKKPTNLLKIPLHDDPFQEPNMSENYRGDKDPIAAEMYQRYEESLQASRLKATDASSNHVLNKANTSGVSTTEEECNDEGDQRDEAGEEEPMDTSQKEQSQSSEAELVMGGRKQSFAKGPFMTHRSAGIHPIREPTKMNDSTQESMSNYHGARRDSMAQSEGDVPQKTGLPHTGIGTHIDGLTRKNSLARRDSVIQRRGSMNRRDSNARMETSGNGRESVTQDSGMTDLTEATHTSYEQGESGREDEGEYESDDDDEAGQTEARPEPVHKFVMIDTLEKGGVFGVLDMAFGAQPSLSLVSNGAECIMVRKKFFKKHSNDKTIWNISQMFRPYPDEDTLTKDLKEKLTWKDHRDVTFKETALKFKKMRKRLADPRLQRPSTIVESFS